MTQIVLSQSGYVNVVINTYTLYLSCKNGVLDFHVLFVCFPLNCLSPHSVTVYTCSIAKLTTIQGTMHRSSWVCIGIMTLLII